MPKTDMPKINVGDAIYLKGEVTRVDDDDMVTIRIGTLTPITIWAESGQIVKVEKLKGFARRDEPD